MSGKDVTSMIYKFIGIGVVAGVILALAGYVIFKLIF
jgi:hypothetical protein